MFCLRFLAKSIFLSALLFIFVAASLAQDDKPASREITSADFQAQRPKAASVKVSAPPSSVSKNVSSKRQKTIAVISNPKRRYSLVKRIAVKKANVNLSSKTISDPPSKNSKQGQNSLKEEELGVTFWRMRPLSEDEEDAPTFPVRIDDRVENWTVERVASTTKFQKDDRVRFTIESSRTGYLYIINREIYADGSRADAEIVFPTLRTRGGENRVTAGSLIEIPASTDSVPFFTIKPRREDYVGEELIVIISPSKIVGYEPGLRAQKVAPETLQKWLNDWETTVDVYDAADGEGVAYTKTESEAAATGNRGLSQEEPLPQTIYRVRVSDDAPLLVPFQMQAKP